jgi:hypothetical protein
MGDIRRVLMPFVKGKTVIDITTSMVKEFHRKKRSNPTDANRGLAVLSAMMTYTIEEGIRPDNPCRGVKRMSETAAINGLTSTICQSFSPPSPQQRVRRRVNTLPCRFGLACFRGASSSMGRDQSAAVRRQP